VVLENKTPFWQCPEVLIGAGMIVGGVGMQAAHLHGFLAEALAPFGVGLILSDAVVRAAKATRVRVRRDDD
jgi:hypothetical protein